MKLKKNKPIKKYRLEIRLNEEQRNRIKTKSHLYTEGNVSEYLIYAAMNFVPGKEDFEIEHKKALPKKGRKEAQGK